MNLTSKIYVAGHNGMVGSALVRRLQQGGYSNILTRTRTELDLTKQAATHEFLVRKKPDFIFIAAAKVGGIHANNTYHADFIYENLTIQNNLIHGVYQVGTRGLCFLGASFVGWARIHRAHAAPSLPTIAEIQEKQS